MVKVIEFFGGIGAFTQAMKRAGVEFEVVDYVEIDKFAVASYNAMNGRNFEPQDISKWDKDIKADIIMHGSPCQDFSVAGKGKGGDEGSGTRSSLMYETLRIIGKVKPKIVIWENVKGLLSPKHRHNFDAYLDRMKEMGYSNYYQVLNAKDYGVPQNRERIFTVSLLDGRDFKFPKKQELKIRLKDILETEVDSNFYLSEKMLEKITRNTKGAEVIEVANLHKGGATEYKHPKQIVDDRCVQVAQMYGTEKEPNPQAGRVYDINGLSPTMDTCGGDNRMPKVLVKEATKKGYAEAEACVLRSERTEYGKAVRKDYESGRIKESRHNMTALAPRTDGISNTLTTVQKDNLLYEPFIAASRGRNPENPSDRTFGAPTVQMLEPNTGGVSNTLTSVQKDNYVVEPVNVYTGFKIRKLTPLECWRLMGFDDDCYERAASVNSNTQLYKQAGNSIVVNVLCEIVKRLAVSVDLGINTEAEETGESTEQVFVQLEFPM